jgi:multidrug efflux pump subunit AcrB
VPLRNFLTIDEERPVRELMRANQRRMVTISGQVVGGSITRAWNGTSDAIARLDLPADVKIVQEANAPRCSAAFATSGGRCCSRASWST